MSRFFAKLTSFHDAWAVNLLEFTGTALTQRVTAYGDQTAEFTGLVYNRRTSILTFKVNGAEESFKMHEITEDVGRKLIEPHNWQNLRHGLNIKSEKTLAWLQDHGIKG